LPDKELTSCNSCGSASANPLCSKFGLTIVRCAGCGLVFVNPRLSHEETARRYSTEYFWTEYLPVVAPAADVQGAVLDLLRPADAPGRLLEVGIGAGFLLRAAVRRGWQAHGLEYSMDAARYARTRFNLPVVRGNAMGLPFASSSFDAGLMFDVIEHLHDPRRALSEVRRCLKPHGELIVTTPNFNALSRAALGMQWAVLSPAEHLYYFTERTLRDLLTRAGFSSVRFVRRHAPWRACETMNAHYTHSPNSLRARAYGAFVTTAGRICFSGVQRLGLADALIAVAS
jgi:SAM-dependent methyltransferase